MKGIVHWREDAKDMTFDEFYKFHESLFDDEAEAKSAYKEVTGKDPSQKPKAVKKAANNINEAE